MTYTNWQQISLGIATVALPGIASALVDWSSRPTGDRSRIAARYFMPQLDTAIQVADSDAIWSIDYEYQGPLIGVDLNF